MALDGKILVGNAWPDATMKEAARAHLSMQAGNAVPYGCLEGCGRSVVPTVAISKTD